MYYNPGSVPPLPDPHVPAGLELRCPATGKPLALRDGEYVTPGGDRRYPVVGGIPVLIAEERSLFSPADFTAATAAAPPAPPSRAARAARRIRSLKSRNVGSEARMQRLVGEIRASARGERPAVLIVGGGIVGHGMEAVLGQAGFDCVETDVYIGPRTAIVCDGHDLPFADGSFDAVVCQAVLEHVLEPHRVAEEIHRVLAPRGVVYAETPFMQQVHEGAYDFTRFTHLGHRRLFRRFDEIESGAVGGPGMALAWAARYFAMSWTRTLGPRRSAADLAAILLTGWLTRFDERLARTPGGLDAASGVYFLGRRRDTPVDDRDIIAAYRGAMRRRPVR